MKCPVCGQIIDDEDEVCPYCGVALKSGKNEEKEEDVTKRQIENYRKNNQ